MSRIKIGLVVGQRRSCDGNRATTTMGIQPTITTETVQNADPDGDALGVGCASGGVAFGRKNRILADREAPRAPWNQSEECDGSDQTSTSNGRG